MTKPEGGRLARLSGMSLDLKLGGRMLIKYPGLTFAGGLAIVIAVALAASFFDFLNNMTSPTLPVPEPARLVRIQNYDLEQGDPDPRTLFDYQVWRAEVKTLSDVSAVSTMGFQVTTDAGRFATLRTARVTPSVFALLGYEPVMGRLLTPADEEDGAPLALVIGYQAWQDLFDGAGDVIGRTMRIGETPGTVVGVMPEGFGFPMVEELWMPLRERARPDQLRAGPPIMVLGRLKPGVAMEDAQAELATLGRQAAAAYPQTHAQLAPRVERFDESIGMGPLVQVLNLPFFLFLIVVCGNVGALVFARTAARAGELALRSALGASRRRLVVQLIAEALVLTSVSAMLGLALAQVATRYAMAVFWEVQQSKPPWWYSDELSGSTILYVAALTVVAAAVIGGLPALKATGRQLRVQMIAAGTGGGGMRFGAVSTVAIVAQVALCVAFLPVAITMGRGMLPDAVTETTFPADQYLSGTVVVEEYGVFGPNAGLADEGAMASLYARLKQRLAEQEGVTDVALVSMLPGMNHGKEAMQLPDTVAEERVLGVDGDFFEMVGARLVAGRDFRPDELQAGAPVMIVDADWANELMPGRSPVGMRVRFTDRADGGDEVSHEIIGVVDEMGPAIGMGSPVAVFVPLDMSSADAQLYLRTTLPPATLAPQVHAAVSGIDPRMRVAALQSLADHWAPVARSNTYFFAGLNIIALIILMFALVGIYSLVSFAVAQRSREVAIRAALGAGPREILVSVFRRAVMQVGLGVLIGAVVVSGFTVRTPGSAALVAGVAASMMLVGLLGCSLPARRALRIQPTDALKGQ